MLTDINHLSYSSISLYLDCAAAWKFKYIDKKPTKSSPALIMGSAFHNTVEQLICNSGNDVLSTWSTEWNKAIEGQPIFWGTDTPEAIFNDGVRMFSTPALLSEIRKIKPKNSESIERKVELSVPGVPIPVIGYIDIIMADGTPADFKTAARSWTDSQAQESLQSLFYLAALNQAGEKINWKFVHYIFIKTKEPKVQILEHSHKPGELFFLFDLIQRVWQGIEKEVFPLNPSTWKCNSKYCDFYANCRGKYV